MRRQSLNTLIAAAIVLAPADANSQRVTDSSGVRIVLYSAPSAEVRLSTPVLTLSDVGCELNRVSGLVIQSTGDIVVTNSGNKAICVFDKQGKFSRNIGREGSGPGEFVWLSPLEAGHADSLVLVDQGLRRLTVFGPEGGKGRSFIIDPPDTLGSHSATLALADGSFILGFSEFKRGEPRPEAVMFWQQLFRVSSTGAQLSRLGRFPIGEHRIVMLPKQGNYIAMPAYPSLAFGREGSFAATRDGFVAGDGVDVSVSEYTPIGRIRAIHRLDLARQPITKADIAAYEAVELKGVPPEQRGRAEAMVNGTPYPSHYPAYRQLRTDDANGIWLELYPAQGSPVRRWIRLDTSRGSAQTLRFPDRFKVFAMRGGLACGVSRDDVDLETISCFAVPR